MTKGIFITATGTDVGKTFVSGLIAKKLCAHGYRVAYYKAALSGAVEENGAWIAGDAKEVCQQAGLRYGIDSKVSYTYKTAVSPHLAAEMEGNPIDLLKIKQDFASFSANYEYLCVEGSGGIICPLCMQGEKPLLLEDIIKTLGLETIIVATAGLGTINATLLTVDYMRARGIGIQGIILNHFDSRNFLHVDNKKQIERLSRLPVLACVKDEDRELDISIEELTGVFREVIV